MGDGMTGRGKVRGGWLVVCDDHQTGPFKTEAIADRQRRAIAALGACTAEHRVVQTDQQSHG
jgi:hypothetical protein